VGWNLRAAKCFFFNMFSSVDVGGCYPLFRRTSIHFENPNMALTHLWVSGIQVISKSKGLATCTTITPTLCILAPERYNAWNNHLCILWSPSCCLITPTWHCSHVLQTLTDPAPESWRDSLFPQKTAYSQKKVIYYVQNPHMIQQLISAVPVWFWTTRSGTQGSEWSNSSLLVHQLDSFFSETKPHDERGWPYGYICLHPSGHQPFSAISHSCPCSRVAHNIRDRQWRELKRKDGIC
jgi:hypothetical protein